MKKIISISVIIAVFLLVFCGCEEQSGYPKPSEKFFVNDFANVIDDADEEEIYSKAVALQNSTTAQVVVVTVDDLNGEEPADYALNLGREWGVGDKEKDNGVVILLSENDREIYIAVGYGLEGALPDSKTGRIIDYYGLEYLKNDDFSKGLLNITNAVIGETYLEYGMEAPEGYTPISQIKQQDSIEGSPKQVAISWIAFICVFIVLSILSRKRGGFFFFFPSGRGGRGGFSGGSFGGFSGGGSFGGFSGGGGSFGGGGAGRGF